MLRPLLCFALPFALSVLFGQTALPAQWQLFAAAALSGAESIQLGPMMLGGRAAARNDLMITREEWAAVKERIRALPDGRVPYTFCDEFICECRADMPRGLLAKWRDPNHAPCPAGRSFGVVGPNGVYRTCLHSLPARRPGRAI